MLLVTAFKPFDGTGLNSAQEALRRALPELEAQTVIAEPPVSWGRDIRCVWPLIKERRPSAILLLGQAHGTQLRLETVARNERYVARKRGELRPILKRGRDQYETTAEARSMLDDLLAAGLPARLSDDAGTYLCNHLYYHVLHRLSKHGSPARAIFLHLPLMPCQAAQHEPDPGSLPPADAARAVALAARSLSAQSPRSAPE